MKVHAVCELFPLMTPEEFEALKADIAENGQREPIWVLRDAIIDGRNRYRACLELQSEPEFREWDGKGSLVKFVVSLNLHRRHLSASQKAMLAADMLPWMEDEAKQRQKDAGARGHEGGRGKRKNPSGTRAGRVKHSGEAREEAAVSGGVGSRYVQDAKKVSAAAPELAKQVREGSLTLPQAKRAVVRKAKREALAAKATAAKTGAGRRPNWKLICGDCLQQLPTLSKVRLLFADPPYNVGIDYGDGEEADRLPADEYLAWCERWIFHAANTLTDDGSMWVMIGDEWAEHYADMLNDVGLHRRAWIKWYETFGNNCVNNFNRCSRHIFYYVVDPERFVFNDTAPEIRRQSDRQTKYKDKRADPDGKLWDDVWQIPRLTDSAAERLPDFPTQVPLAITRAIVACVSEPGDLVVDPFAGSGSLGHAAIELGRRFVGIEKRESFCDQAKLRLQGVTT